jgi:hypothetical protein
MGRHARVRSKEGPKAPRGGDSQVKPPRKGGETFDWVSDRGEISPRCKFCKTVVPLRLWHHHACPSQRPPF